MSKRKNPFYFGQRIMCPHASSSRIITEVVDDKHIRVLDIVEMTPAQRADWGRTPIEGELKFVPGLVIDIEGVMDWDEYMRPLEEASKGAKVTLPKGEYSLPKGEYPKNPFSKVAGPYGMVTDLSSSMNGRQ